MKAVCLISGGLDSFVSAAVARKQGYRLSGLTVDYSQTHGKEIDSAVKVAQFLKMSQHRVIKLDLSWLSSSLTDKTISIPEEIPEGIPSTYVPARNTIFISLALALAETAGANAIFLGVNHIDYSGYPDCRPEYIEEYQRLINLATKKTVEGEKIVLQSPLLNLSKSEIIRLGNKLKLDFSITRSCYRNNENACGKCPSCLIRLAGFREAGLKDPLKYDT